MKKPSVAFTPTFDIYYLLLNDPVRSRSYYERAAHAFPKGSYAARAHWKVCWRAYLDRDPRARAWERWNPTDWRREVTLENGDVVSIWTEVTTVADGVVDACHTYRFPGGLELRSEMTLLRVATTSLSRVSRLSGSTTGSSSPWYM